MKRIPLFQRLQIESQANCNRSCWFCPRTYDRSGKYLNEKGKPSTSFMPTEKIIDILDQAEAMGFRGGVTFYSYSEPLLDKRNVFLAREAGKRGMKPYIHTNGDFLKNDDVLCREITALYEYIVIGLYDYSTNEELERTKQYWENRLSGANLQFSAIGLAGSRSARNMAIPRALVPADRRMAVPDLIYMNGPCRRPLIRMIIRHDGEMCNCCEDMHGDFRLGNIYQNSLEELWFSDDHVKVVKDLQEGKRERYELCAHCPLSPTGPGSNGNKINIARRSSSALNAYRL